MTAPTTNSAATVSMTWPIWNTVYTTGTYAATTWTAWSSDWYLLNTTITIGSVGSTYIPPAPTEEQLEAQAARFAEAERRRAQEEAEQRQALERARALRDSLLDERQRADLAEHGYFDVVSSAGRTWRIWDQGQAGNVDLLGEDGAAQATYCIHPFETVPDPDAHVAQMLTLVTDEEEFTRVGNRSSPNRARRERHALQRERQARREAQLALSA